ncbi:MAG: trigger factor [Thermoleophilia bacterium]|nr:trigger factor [Thermoleophilia bacterium]
MTDLKTTVTSLPDNKVRLDVEVPAEELRLQVDKTVRKLSREVRMSGFRPGKVPRNLIVQRFGKDAILAQTLEDALPGWLQRAIDGSGIKPVDQPEVDLADSEAGLDELLDEKIPLAFKAVAAVMPRPKVGKYTGMEVEKDVVSVTDADVDEQVDMLRRRLGRLEEVKVARPAGEGDYVLIDFTGYLDGEPLEGGASKDYMLELGSKQFIPGFEDQIEGMEKGQSKSFKLAFPEDYKPERLASQDVEFDVTVKEIKERVLPEADDEFAKENSEFDSIAEMREGIKARLQDAGEEEAEKAFRARAVEKAVNEAEVEIPPQAVATRAHELEMDFVTSLQARGVSADQYLNQSAEEKEKFAEHFRTQAETVLKREAVLETVADIEDIEVAEEEVEEEIRKAAPRVGKEPEELILEMKQKGRTGIVRDDLIHKKAAAYIAEHAIPVLKKAGAVSPEEKEKEEKESGIITP